MMNETIYCGRSLGNGWANFLIYDKATTSIHYEFHETVVCGFDSSQWHFEKHWIFSILRCHTLYKAIFFLLIYIHYARQW